MADYPSPDYVETILARLRGAGVQPNQIEFCPDGILRVNTSAEGTSPDGTSPEGPRDEFSEWESQL